MADLQDTPPIKPQSPSGSVSIGPNKIDINSQAIPSSPPPDEKEIENKLNKAVQNNSFKIDQGNGTTSEAELTDTEHNS